MSIVHGQTPESPSGATCVSEYGLGSLNGVGILSQSRLARVQVAE